MLAVKRINHNAAICEDAAGRQLIALGKGIGFGEFPHEVALKDVQRTFYGIDAKYLSFIDEVDPEVLEFCAQFADIVRQQVSYELSANLPITLADHIQFAIKRAREHMVVSMPLSMDVEQCHPVEYRLATMALTGIRRTFKVRMPKNETAGIALSIVNAAVSSSAATLQESRRADEVIERATRLIEHEMSLQIDRGSFAYARFATHVRYLLGRVETGEPIESGNADLYQVLKEQYPQVDACARGINKVICGEFGSELTDEELTYLMLHINRIVGMGLKQED